MLKKIKIIYFPFLISSIGFLVGYTFLKWLLVIELKIIQPKEELLEFFLPLGISGIIMISVLRSRIKLLKLSDNNKDICGFLFWILLSIPVIAAQSYIDTKLGQLTHINFPSEIELQPETLYYSIQNFKGAKQYSGLYITQIIANRHGTEMRITCHFACPIFDNTITNPYKLDTINTWLGVEFSKKFSKRLFENDYKKESINAFIQSSINDYDKYKFSTDYLITIPNSDEKDNYLGAINRTHLQYDKLKLKILKEEKGNYNSRNGNSSSWILGILISSNFSWLLMVVIIKTNKSELKKFEGKERKKYMTKDMGFLRIFIPHKDNWAIPILMDINILVFLIMLFSGVSIMNPQNKDLIMW